ncbi:MAG: hypothetical protein RIR41_2545 [Pseudomonadota bacterium]
MSKLTPRDVESIVRLFDAGDWKALELRFGDGELFLSRSTDELPSWSGGAAANPHPRDGLAQSQPVAAPPATNQAQPTAPIPGHVVVAPSLGTFYRAPKPGAPAFVEVGSRVTPDTELCLVEVMKLFTTLRAGVSGTVSRVLVADGEMITLGRPLFAIDLDD